MNAAQDDLFNFQVNSTIFLIFILSELIFIIFNLSLAEKVNCIKLKCALNLNSFFNYFFYTVVIIIRKSLWMNQDGL